VAWPQLNRYVENLYAADCKRHERQLILKQEQELQDSLKRLHELQLILKQQQQSQGSLKQQHKLRDMLERLQELQQEQHEIADSAGWEPAATPEERGKTARAVVREIERSDQYRSQFRSRSLKVILKQSEALEPLLALARDRLEFQPGDYQRDQIVRNFADAMVVAWMSATGEVPTISKSKPLPFQQLLSTINRKILKPEIKHETDFRYPAVRAANRARRRMKGENPRP
jgi:hypothetical protein